jgi:hypothetical protein
MRATRQAHAVLGTLGLLWCSLCYPAQATTLEIAVLDATNGKPLPGAKVVLVADRNVDERFMGPEGSGRSVDLEPGRYTLEVSLAGFKTFRQEIELSVGANEKTVELEPFRLVSLIQLLATPDRFDGLPVVVDGFCSVGFEDDALFLHKDDWTYSLTSNALRIDAGPAVVDERYNKKYVTLFGVFSTNHGQTYAGSIGSIERVVQLDRRK